jgi:hypothetical protein
MLDAKAESGASFGAVKRKRLVGGGWRGHKLVLWGGNANNGSQCGLAYGNSNNAFSNSNANYGARHTLIHDRAKALLQTPSPQTLTLHVTRFDSAA